MDPNDHGRRTLVMIPGLGCDDDLFRDQAAALGEQVAVVVSAVSQGASLADMARSALAAAPQRFALAGLSMGGYVVWEILRQAPERVTAVALLDTSARPDEPEQTARRLALVALAQAGRYAEDPDGRAVEVNDQIHCAAASGPF